LGVARRVKKAGPALTLRHAAHRFAVQIFVQSQTHLSADVATESGRIGFVDFPHHAADRFGKPIVRDA
jgi:hypothetical protein